MTFDDNATPADPETVSPDEPSVGARTGSGPVGSRRRLLTVAAAAIAAIAGVTAAHAASAEVSTPALEQPDPAATSFDADFWRRQDLLVDLRGWIEGMPGLAASGYVTTINNKPVDGSTVVVWYGPPDSVQRQIIDEARRRHIPLSIQLSKHTMNDFDEAVNQLSAIGSGTGVFQNFTVNMISNFEIYFAGVTVVGEYIRPPAEGVAAADTALAQVLTAITGVDVRVQQGDIVW